VEGLSAGHGKLHSTVNLSRRTSSLMPREKRSTHCSGSAMLINLSRFCWTRLDSTLPRRQLASWENRSIFRERDRARFATGNLPLAGDERLWNGCGGGLSGQFVVASQLSVWGVVERVVRLLRLISITWNETSLGRIGALDLAIARDRPFGMIRPVLWLASWKKETV
jgi:hypothetical protein